MPTSKEEIRRAYIEADLLFSQSEIHQALHNMAGQITADLAEAEPLILTVMNGGLLLTGQLLPLLEFPLECTYIHATRYRNSTSGHEIEWKSLPDVLLKDRNILIIDDILDEGITLKAVIDFCQQQGAKSVSTAVLLEKQHQRKAIPDLTADYTGLEVEDRYVFGFGLDYKGYWRNAAGIFALRE